MKVPQCPKRHFEIPCRHCSDGAHSSNLTSTCHNSASSVSGRWGCGRCAMCHVRCLSPAVIRDHRAVLWSMHMKLSASAAVGAPVGGVPESRPPPGLGCKIESKYLSKNLHIFHRKSERQGAGNLLKATADAGAGHSRLPSVCHCRINRLSFVSLFTWP